MGRWAEPLSEDRFVRRTSRGEDHDAAELAARKDATGSSVSVVIPALDEERTVGHVVTTLREHLVDRVGLIDELVVIDADSTDATAARARDAGARVVSQSAVLPEAGPGSGKGEALWKGLAATSGELIVFIDADVVDIGPGFVVGLLGPLLADTELALTKASYDRPLQVGETVTPSGGGRVTELLARPLLATFWPELAWIAQPLAGEYAGRRTVLESLPFVRGYGVELALLIDLAERYGPDAIAQVDLGRRRHEHQPLPALGKMAAELLHVALDRLGHQGRVLLTDPLATTLLQPLRDEDGELGLAAHPIATGQRPPLATWRREAR